MLAGTNCAHEDPPEPGKKYFSYNCCMHHQWSRGSIVCLLVPIHPALDLHMFAVLILLSWLVVVPVIVDRIQHIASTDPFASPLIDPHAFEEDIGECSDLPLYVCHSFAPANHPVSFPVWPGFYTQTSRRLSNQSNSSVLCATYRLGKSSSVRSSSLCQTKRNNN